MTPDFIAILALLGALGFTSGLLGVGGGVVMFPVLLYVPSLLGFERLDAKTVAAVVVAQGIFLRLNRRCGPLSQWASAWPTNPHSRHDFGWRCLLGRDCIEMGF